MVWLVVGPGVVAGRSRRRCKSGRHEDGDGNRLSASTGTDPSQVTSFVWDTNRSLPQLALERNGNNAVLRSYLYGVRRISMTTGGSDYYYAYDGLGSAVNVASSTGATEWTYSYEPFGAIRTQTQNDANAPENPMRFTGEFLDLSGLYDLRARDYDPSSGRFLETDPLGSSTSSTSPYEYAADRPTCLGDPSGKVEAAVLGGGSDYCLVEIFNPKHFYCSRPWYGYSAFEGTWNKDGDCYYHDLCYGSTLDRKFCDDCSHSLLKKTCKSHYGWFYGINPVYGNCLSDAELWYKAVRWRAASHYHPHCGAAARADRVLQVCPRK